jgi:tetratricopeptide (TPR) repeat protein
MNRPGAGGSAANRPNWSNRPGAGGGGTQRPNAGNRPDWGNRPGAGGNNWANRPGAGGGGTQWANAGNRSDWANRPGAGGNNWANRPGAGGSGTQWANAGNRPGNWNNANWNNRPNNWVNNGNINRGNTFVNQNNFNQNNIANNRFNNINNRPWGYNAYQSNWANWHSGSWNNWNTTPAAWYGAGAATAVGSSLLWGAGTNYTYSNPFYVASPAVATTPALDYSQPVQVPAPVNVGVDTTSYSSPATYASAATGESMDTAAAPVTTAPQEAPPPSSTPATPEVPPEATEYFDLAREAFKSEQYDRALKEVEEAIRVLPKDTTLHEFRALVLFAQGKYKDAASGIYAVLAVGPGWNWETMSGLYANPDTYTKQLRALESYVRQNLNAADGRFLLAYHYLVLNSISQAVTELKEFEKLVPKDQLAPQLVKAFTESPDTGKPKAEGA